MADRASHASAGPPVIGSDEAVEAARLLVPSSGRTLLGLAGAPGAGKSTLAARIVAVLGPATAVVPMDGFHLSAVELRERGLADVKGAPETFDRSGFVALLRRLRSDRVVSAPGFDRSREVTVPDAVEVGEQVRLAVVEGNYLLRWPEARAALNEVWFVEASSKADRVERLVHRHVHFGRTPGEARLWAERSDEANARLITADRGLADRVVRPW